MAKIKHAVIRTDLMSGTAQPADLVSFRFYTAATKDGVTVYTPAEVENGTVVKLLGYEDNLREVYKAVAATSSDNLGDCAIAAGVEVMYDERLKALEDYTNEAGKIVRGYIPRSRNTFSVTKEAFVGGTVPVKGDTIGIGTGGKLDKTGSGLGVCTDIEVNGLRTWYAVRIGATE